MPDDNCPTPWDMCCEDKKTIAANSVTVQVVGADGRPLKAELKGVSGLKPLSEVTVKGKVQKSPDGKAVTVDATEMYVKQGCDRREAAAPGCVAVAQRLRFAVAQ